MLRALKQVRAAAGLLNPAEVRRLAERPLTIGVAAPDAAGAAAVEDFLLSAAAGREQRLRLMERIFRVGDVGAPEQFDLLIAAPGSFAANGAFWFDPADPERTVQAILDTDEDYGLSLPLARQFPAFRPIVVERVVHSVARENALFALATALPNVVPGFLLPWGVGEFASDTAFLTMNQVRMAFLVAAACGREIGLAEQKVEVLSIAAGALGWRAIARELAGKIPMGGGLIPKAAIAYAGTFVIGKGLEHFHGAGRRLSRQERRDLYSRAYERGRQVAEGLRSEIG
jgi:hypothetical protein